MWFLLYIRAIPWLMRCTLSPLVRVVPAKSKDYLTMLRHADLWSLYRKFNPGPRVNEEGMPLDQQEALN